MGASAGTSRAAVEQPAAWATPSIRAVTSAGLMGAKDVQSFRAPDPLTAQALENLVFDLRARFSAVPQGGGPGKEAGATAPTLTHPPTTTTAPTPTATTTPPPAPAPTPAPGPKEGDD